ncbi:MAG: phosphoribosylglycinamide formyltransferase [Alistipes sp.]|nr:phosphoribosylglycinamide formyltransferase [Alistipes senegalensis]MCM1250914.1 phosphoribosylglycinamide formyltransferase [Alistipes sp.]
MHRIAVFASGSGTNFEAIVSAAERGELDAQVVLMVCDKPGAQVIARAAAHGVEAWVFAPKEYASKADYEREILARLDAAGIELVCLAGYMRIVGDTLLEAYGGRIVNIHPSLLPAFRGAHAIEQALEYGVKVFGVTVHWVDATLDGGRIIAQRAFPYEGDDAEELERMIHATEYPLYVETIGKILNNR